MYGNNITCNNLKVDYLTTKKQQQLLFRENTCKVVLQYRVRSDCIHYFSFHALSFVLAQVIAILPIINSTKLAISYKIYTPCNQEKKTR